MGESDFGRRLDSVLRYSQKHGYESVVYRGVWKECEIYEMILSHEFRCTGLPRFAIAEKERYKISTDEETMDILDWLRRTYGAT